MKTSLKKIVEQSDDFFDPPGIISEDAINVEVLKDFIENFEGSTYPIHILKRRLGLLNKFERARVLQNWKEIHECAENIDNTISKRAELEGDEWK